MNAKVRKYLAVGTLACLSVAARAEVGVASGSMSGVYLSQFAASDPQAARGGTDPVFLVLVQNGNTSLATVNAWYTHPTARWTSKVWSYGIFTGDANYTSTSQIVDSFEVCDNTVRATFQPVSNSIVVESLATTPKTGVANPLGIDCNDLYPVPLTRTFTRVF